MGAIDLSKDESANLDAITALARETHHPLPIVKRIYEAELSRLREDARITDYVSLFASRRTRDALLKVTTEPRNA
jgi:hypothetical protein